MSVRRRLIGLVGVGAAAVAWGLGVGLPLALLVGLVVTAVLLVTLTRPAGRSRRGADDSTLDDVYGRGGWGSPATNMLLWGGLLFGWANGTGGGGDHFDAGGGLDGGGGFDAGGGFEGGGGGSE